MSIPKIEVEIRPSGQPGPTKAHADVRLLFSSGELQLIGFAIVKQPGKKTFVGFPRIAGVTSTSLWLGRREISNKRL